ncbi:serine/threonine protein kinase [Beutenbergia cavernae DSM 12333]|uniref:non-specific serine/threonine protein kinase n=1 Tax=Beutenbergia cavernae (strain ATCC BAA-8 / DSM 12333 / CCUG 43141 / JCM 11478 / NBRC 16432 / NCIMB 13614 / HKI 0122) TaxID=471853 RepID=C5C4N5_BEUC1|nr:serine/threonine-protein kinase [Beutenbergia cavernae]ACQ80013.1 serine/threonine protein kinase [Beutenbergia cavernae DSM 12333]
MSPRRAPSPPPSIPGYRLEKLLGSGGFSDVFLYEQAMPRRRVAVKVLLAHADGPDERAQFAAEANLMAQLSTHPAIATIYHADTAEDGRPYLVMEYCSRPNLSVRYRQERIGVAEALRIGVRLSGAAETAHRAGILHRDIKPANVLTNDYGWPALTDFGISVLASGADSAGDEVGMSIPWAAPEFFADDAPRGVAADVYALAATIYTILAGRSPFERVGGSNTALDLITRIEREPVPPIGRQDVPASLERVLERGLAKHPSQRYATALDFARALQQVEQELRLAPTPIDVPDTSWIADAVAASEENATRVRAVTTVDPVPRVDPLEHTVLGGSVATRQQGAATPDPFLAGYTVPPPTEPTAPPGHDPAAPSGAGRRTRWWVWATATVTVLAALVVVVLVNRGAETPVEPPTSTAPDDPTAPPPVVAVPEPEDLAGVRDGEDVTFTWTLPDDVDPADYSFSWTEVGGDGRAQPVDASPLTLTDRTGTVCVEVRTRADAGGRLSGPVSACVG